MLTDSKKIWITGFNGQVGYRLSQSCQRLGNLILTGRKDVDLAEKGAIERAISDFNPDIIINAAAYTKVDEAEKKRDLATTMNESVPKALATLAAERNIFFIHLSTDYVFDGASSQPYKETDDAQPLNFYGSSKLAGERAVADAGGNSIIFRTGWVYDELGSNFARTIIKLLMRDEPLKVVDDQFGSPTPAKLIAEIIAKTIEEKYQDYRAEPLCRLYHLTAEGKASWYQFATVISDAANLYIPDLKEGKSAVVPITTSMYKQQARRPMDSALDTTLIKTELNVELPHWKSNVAQCVKGILSL